MSSDEADMIDKTAEGEMDDDLFGDEDQSDGPAEKVRELSDRELDSGDDDDRNDRAPRKAAEEVDEEGRTAQIMDATVWRHPLPKPADGEVSLDPVVSNLALIFYSSISCAYQSSWASIHFRTMLQISRCPIQTITPTAGLPTFLRARRL
jgi:hypothetical protein